MYVSNKKQDYLVPMKTSNNGTIKAPNVWFENRCISDTNETVHM